MRRPWPFLLVIAAIIAAYVWVFVWGAENAPEDATTSPPISIQG